MHVLRSSSYPASCHECEQSGAHAVCRSTEQHPARVRVDTFVFPVLDEPSVVNACLGMISAGLSRLGLSIAKVNGGRSTIARRQFQ